MKQLDKKCCRHLFRVKALLVLLQLAVVASAYYTPATLQRLAQASSLSYLALDKMPSSPYYKECQLQPLLQVVDPVSESGATVFVDEISKKVVVACRGSANPKNFGTNLKFKFVPATRLSQTNIPDNALVHEGFQDASVGLWKKLGPNLMGVLKDYDQSSPKDVVFTGHSLGAATALLCAVHYRATYSTNFSKSPTVITFGGPKLCNGVLASYIRNDALEGSDILHLVRSGYSFCPFSFLIPRD